MRDYRFDHIHLRSPNPDATATFFETMFGAEAKRDIYPPGTIARYIRLTFANVPAGGVAGLAELEVHGVLSVR